MKLTRRLVLRGTAGAVMALPFLEGLIGRGGVARADADAPPFAVFFRQANGVAAAQSTVVGSEPERFWPRATGPLTLESLADRALEELGDHRARLPRRRRREHAGSSTTATATPVGRCSA
ncbi:MAG: hypothetical protein M5U28_53900 [Sandaracinaceae bacterium]|nr:hypothetical protein [Sandaracinaceae bacterium]